MTEVVKFPVKREEPKLWVCECGCSSFELMSDKRAICALCHAEAEGLGGWYLPKSETEWEGESPIREVSGNGDATFAKRVISKRVMDEDSVLVVVLKEDATISTWSNIETAEQRKWADRQLRRVKALLGTGKA